MKILFLPDHPDREYYSLVTLFRLLEYTATKSPDDDFDAGFLWQDTTQVVAPPALLAVAGTRPVLNLRCTDIGKTRVEEVFREVFGYGSFVDPTRHVGRCVVKSEENAASWGSVVQGPIAAPQAGSVYQAFIDSERDGVQIELRTPIILGTIPEVKVWRREAVRGPLNQRSWLDTTVIETAAIYTPDERDRILEFADRMGLDFGELDVLRAGDDGRIYILDVNKTPSDYGMISRVRWDPAHRRRSIANLAATLDRELRARLS